MAQKKKSVKKSHLEEKTEKAVFLSSKRSKTTKKNSWEDKDLTNKQKTHTKKCFEENGAI